MNSGPRHPALVDHEVLDLALGLTDIVDLATHAVAKPFDLACAEANLHQLGGNLLLQLEVLRRLVAFLLQNGEHARVQASNHREALESRDLEPLQVFRGDRSAVVLAFLAFLFIFVDRCEGLGEVHQSIDDVVDLELVALDLAKRGRGSARRSSDTRKSP